MKRLLKIFFVSTTLFATPLFADIIQCPTTQANAFITNDADHWAFHMEKDHYYSPDLECMANAPSYKYDPSQNTITAVTGLWDNGSFRDVIVKEKSFTFAKTGINSVGSGIVLKCTGTYFITADLPGKIYGVRPDEKLNGTLIATRKISLDEYKQCVVQPDGISFVCIK